MANALALSMVASGNAMPVIVSPSGNATPAVVVSSGPSQLATLVTGGPATPIYFADGGQSEANLWRDAVIASGGTVSPARLTLLTNFIATEKTNGTWDLTDDYWVLSAENSQQALISLKGVRQVTAVAAPTFTANVGYTFNGTTNYLDTGWIPSVNGRANSNVRLAVWERTDVSGSSTSFGCQSTTSRSIKIQPRNAANMLGNACSQPATFTLPVATSIGFTAISRNGTLVTDVAAYKNGVAMTRTVDPTNVGSFPDISLYLGAQNSSGTAVQFRACQVAFGCVGAALTPAQELAQYNAVLTLVT